ncbi:hypothetical protein EJ110_NYTH56267 [Nymphaea thermarum]|nr:hypothetical protein EJ110_NYTH56267 [Nymphaea thermarum]
MAMASLIPSKHFLTLIILASLLCAAAATARPHRSISTRTFIVRSCRKTHYPSVCLSSLEKYAGQIQCSSTDLARAALLESLAKARSTSDKVSRLRMTTKAGSLSHRQISAIKDCVENVAESIDMLKQSLGEVEHLKRKSWGLEMNDLETWVSAALTDEDTCTEGFAGRAMNGLVKQDIRACIRSVAQLTSNALDLINKLSRARGRVSP